ncbi:NAD(P)-binding protein [Variovorax terrae]|uniref:NAD(P)/FAD-dependent oxidoreductase n=1 Tax=Variovorax terrae TaxID=2923278 RepID=A0A9X2APV4_9BURK|nr:NAD(P)-binding protein [Variovorax terrae]MCJ0765739.1 NAD(P)/FAD-dependent oxidoreductase [Variovorax terrae]
MRRRGFLASTTALPLLGCAPPRHEIAGGFTGINVARGHALRDTAAWPAPGAVRRTRVLIAGGGVAGLAAARALRLRGIDDFALLELENEAGGNSRGGSVQGVACPLGAHYLPVPGDDAREVQDLLEEFGLRRREAGRWVYDERHLCHSPQERLFFRGAWQEGLLPVQDVGRETLAQYRRFAARVEQLRREAKFSIPVSKAPKVQVHWSLDAMTFVAWLNQEGFGDPQLRWYLDYCCRDDYGAGIASVSAWAGIHYFASRHGFSAPDEPAAGERDGLLTWPEGNAWLTRRLAVPLGERLRAGCTVLRIAEGRHGVELDAYHHASRTVQRWQAERCIVALPAFIAARVVQNPPPFLARAAARLRYAPWLVANLHLDAPLQDRPGAAPAWDNVIYRESGEGGGLGYVDARHQALDPRPAPTVLTYYQALGDTPGGRRLLLERPWEAWRDAILAALSVPHPDLPARTTRIDITRYGHAMAMPVPGILKEISPMSSSSGRLMLSNQEQSAATPATPRLRFAHSDWSGYSIFEEAFTRGHAAGMSPAVA